MPPSLRTHLLDIEVGLISETLWEDENHLQMMADKAQGRHSTKLKDEFIDKLFRRVLVQTAFQVKEVGHKL